MGAYVSNVHRLIEALNYYNFNRGIPVVYAEQDHMRYAYVLQFADGMRYLMDGHEGDNWIQKYEYETSMRRQAQELQKAYYGNGGSSGAGGASMTYARAAEPIRAGDVVEMDRNGMMYRAWYATKTYVGYDPGMMHPGVAKAPVEPCKSCNETHKEEKLDHHGFCKKSAEKFWGKVHRLYWHRHIKNKNND